MVRTVAVIAALTTAAAVVPATLAQADVLAAPAAPSDQAPAAQATSRTAKAGLAPQWVQYPYLSGGKKGKLTVVAKVYLDPVRLRARAGLQQDRLRMRVAVSKKKFSKVNKPRSVALLPDSALLMRTHKTRKVDKPGVLTIKVPLSKKTSNKLRDRGFKGQRTAVAVSVSHRKDTKKGGSPHEVIQVGSGPLVKGKWSKSKVQRATAGARQQRVVQRRSTAQGAELAYATMPPGASNSDTPWFNTITVSNNSPFQQQISFQPVIQCMYSAPTTYADPNAPTPAPETVNAGDTLSFTLAMPQGWLVYPGYDGPAPAPGLYGGEKGLNAPGTQGNLATDLVNSANAAGQNAADSAFNESTYTDGGMVGAIAAASVRFLVSFFEGLKVDTCNNTAEYPQLFGVSTVVTGFGTNGVSNPSQAEWPATNTWAGNSSSGNFAAGNQGAFTDTPTSDFITGTLQQALGAQTNALYYWNGGAPAPMVSPNASSGSYTGGSATFQDGLMQYVGPNPGFPGGAMQCKAYDKESKNPYSVCKYTAYGEMSIQLSYLTNPQYTAGMLNEGEAPTMTATVDSDGTYTLTCDLSRMTATLTTPFGEGAPTTVEQSTLTNTATNGSGQLPQNADWLVNFFGVNANGEPVYIQESVTSATNGVNTPYLAPNAANVPVSIQAASGGSGQSKATGQVSADNMADMVTLDGTPSVPTQFGCTASPTISLPGLKINAPDGSAIAAAYGNNWPVPTTIGEGGGWPVGVYGNRQKMFDFKWQTPVTKLNVTFQGPPLRDITDVPQG
jgi:hypothetical protein